jgi:hypothetical protein
MSFIVHSTPWTPSSLILDLRSSLRPPFSHRLVLVDFSILQTFVTERRRHRTYFLRSDFLRTVKVDSTIELPSSFFQKRKEGVIHTFFSFSIFCSTEEGGGESSIHHSFDFLIWYAASTPDSHVMNRTAFSKNLRRTHCLWH